MSGCNQKNDQENIESKEEDAAQVAKPPVADKIAHYYEINGTRVEDNYFWLRDKENPEVIAYLEAENSYAESVMKPAAALRETLFEELKARIKEDDSSVPIKEDAYFYYYRTEKDKQYPIYCRKKGSLEEKEEIVLDVNTLAEGQPYFSLGSFEVSPDHQTLAYTTDTIGDENYSLYIKDIHSRALLEEPVPGLSYSVAWANDNQSLFYTVRDEAYRPYKLFLHKVGSPYVEDKMVFHEEDDRFFLSVTKSKNNRFLLLTLTSKTTSETHYLNADNPNIPFKIFTERVPDVKYKVYSHNGYFFILTNLNALNYRLMKTPESATAMGNWTEVLPGNDSVKLADLEIFNDYLALFKLKDGLKQIEVVPFNGNEAYAIAFDDPAYSLIEAPNPDFFSNKLIFTYTSLVHPKQVMAYDMRNKTREVLKTEEVLNGYNASDYVTERIFASAGDGTEIPISLVYKKQLKRDGENPLYLYGYGAYGYSIDPAFNANRISLLDRGFVYAIAHIRGGGDMGEQWYLEGKLLNKKNSFTDFIACAEHLIAENYTHKEKLVAMGGSAGGLLMGAVVNIRPELFEVVVAKVPFVDVVNTMLDESLPLTITEYEEWGNPNQKTYFDYIRSYSPYENVKAQAYPHMLITAGLNDPRVSYWEPAKWTAKLRALKTDHNRLLLTTNMEAGHGGASGRHDYLKEVAFEYAFVLNTLFGSNEHKIVSETKTTK